MRYSTLLFGTYVVITDRSIASFQEIFQSIPVEDKEVGLP